LGISTQVNLLYANGIPTLKQIQAGTEDELQPNEIYSLWKAFEQFNVRFILAGDLAVHFYTSLNFTNEFEIYIDGSIKNRTRLGEAME